MTQRNGATKSLWRRTLRAVTLIALVLGSAPEWLPAEEGKSVARADLEKVAGQSTAEITTTGRKSGKPHTKPIWFVYDQGHLYLQSGKEGKSDWYLNLKKNPQLGLKIGDLTFSGKARFVEDAQETERIHGLFSSKYLLARAAGVVGSSIGHGKPIEIEIQ